ncbi:hypothetical protein Tco_0548743 [Tanacetum coccineum]
MDELHVRLNILRLTISPEVSSLMTLLHEINEIAFVVKLMWFTLVIITEHAPAVALPTRTDDQILPSAKDMVASGYELGTAFTASSTILVIYIQQFWDTMCSLNSSKSIAYSSHDYCNEYVTLWDTPLHASGHMSASCLLSALIKPSRSYPVYDQHVPHRKNLATEARRKKKTLHLLILNVRFTKLIIHHLRTKHNIHLRTGLPLYYSHEESVLNTLRFVRKNGRKVFGMPIPDALLTDEIKSAPYYSRYLKHVAEYQRCLDEEHGKAEEEDVTESPKAAKATKSKTAKQTKPSAPKASKVTKPPKPTPTTTEPSKKDQTGKVTNQRKPKSPLQLVDEFVNEGVPEQEPGPARPVVIREPDSGRIQPLPDVQGKGKEKVSDEQVALDLLTLQTPKKKNPGLTDSETESDEEVSPEINAGTQDEGHAGPNPGEQDEGQAGPNLGPNLEHMDFEVTNASTQKNPKQMDEEFTTMAYPNVQENLKLPTEDQVILEEPASSAGTLSSLQNLDKELSFTN